MRTPPLTLPVAALAAGLLLGFSLLGHALAHPGPWDGLEDHMSAEASPEPVMPAAGATARGWEVLREDTSVSVEGETLGATVIAPQGPGPHPAVALVHGAGRGDRSGLTDVGEAFARAGVVALVADKRTVDYSFANRDFELLADDALAAVDVLRERDDVDTDRVGLWGVSEGAAWVAPLAARRAEEVGFLILVSGPMMTPLEQSLWFVDEGLRRARAPRGVRNAAQRFLARGTWSYLHHDPLPPLEEVRQPVLGIYGDLDTAMPASQSAQTLADTLEAGASTEHTVHLFSEADHGLRGPSGAFVPGYLDTMTKWIMGLPAGTGAADAAGAAGDGTSGSAGSQSGDGDGLAAAGASTRRDGDRGAIAARDSAPPPAAAEPPPAVPWYGSFAAEATAYALAVLAFVAGPIARRVRRRRGADLHDSELWHGLHHRLRRLRRWSIGFTAGLHGLIAAAIALGVAGLELPVVLGAGWLAVRLAAVAAVVLAAVAAYELRTQLLGWRPTGAQAVAVTGGFAGPALLLAAGAYWGVFAAAW